MSPTREQVSEDGSPGTGPEGTRIDGCQIYLAMTRPERVSATRTELRLLGRAVPHTVVWQGHRLAAWTWRAQGPRVLVVHGWSSRASHLARLIETLHEAGFEVAGYDAPAHGDSEGEASSVVEMGQAALAVAEELGPMDALVAHSVGSPAALYAFSRGLEIDASVHFAGPTSLDRAMRRMADMFGLPESEMAAFYRLMEKRIGMPVAGLELDRLRSGFRHPALLLHDPDDQEVPWDESLALNAAWPGSELHAVRGAGHRRILENGYALRAVAAFFAGLGRRRDATA